MSSKVEPFPEVRHAVLGYPSRLLSRTWVAKDTVAFQFQRPRNFLFRPGQFIDLALGGVTGNGSHRLVHTFSIASSCFASNLLVVTRMRDSDFKRALSLLPLGTEVSIRGPMGSSCCITMFQGRQFSLPEASASLPFSACFPLPRSTKHIHLSFSFMQIDTSKMPHSWTLSGIWKCQIGTSILSQRSLAWGRGFADGRWQWVPSTSRCSLSTSVIGKIRSTTLLAHQAWLQQLTRR